MIAWLADVAYNNRAMFDVHSQKIATMMHAIARFCWLVDTHKHWLLPQDVADDMHDMGHKFLLVSNMNGRTKKK